MTGYTTSASRVSGRQDSWREITSLFGCVATAFAGHHALRKHAPRKPLMTFLKSRECEEEQIWRTTKSWLPPHSQTRNRTLLLLPFCTRGPPPTSDHRRDRQRPTPVAPGFAPKLPGTSQFPREPIPGTVRIAPDESECAPQLSFPHPQAVSHLAIEASENAFATPDLPGNATANPAPDQILGPPHP